MVPLLNLLNAPLANRCADGIVAWRAGQAVSNRAFLGRVADWSKLLQTSAGERFALFHGDAVEFAAALLGGWQARKTMVLPGDILPATYAALRASVAGFLGEFPSDLRPLAAPLGDENLVLPQFAALDPDFVGVVLYTSGSTGAAQPVDKKLRQLAAEVAHLESQFGAQLAGADIVSTVSHQHIYGLLFNILWPLAAGRRIHAGSFTWFENLVTTLAQGDAALVSSPAHLSRLPENPGWKRAAQRLRAIFSSGGPLALDAAQECQRLLGQLPIEVYGSSETGGIAWRQQQSGARQPWTALPGVEWRLGDSDGGDGVEKILAVRSAHLPDQDWFDTADLVQDAGAGKFVLAGRVDRIAKIEGKRISLSKIDGLLDASPWVATARTVGLDGRRQRVAAFIVPSNLGWRALGALGRRAFTRQLRGLLVDAIEPVGLPRLWRYLEALPVNGQGKTSQRDLLALLEAKPAPITEPHARLLERQGERAVFELVAPRELVYFDGHFTGQPILSGVVQVDWAIALGRRCFDLPPRFHAIQMLKFQRLILPETRFELELIYQAASATLSFKITTELGTHASGRIVFGGADV